MYIMKRAHLDTTRNRWVGALASYNFNIEYQKGRNNIVTDALSHYYCLWDRDVKEFLTEALSHQGPATRAEAFVPVVQDEAEACNKSVEEIAIQLG